MNHIGRLFQINIYGESHGESVGILLDGVKPGISLSKEDFQKIYASAFGIWPFDDNFTDALLVGVVKCYVDIFVAGFDVMDY